MDPVLFSNDLININCYHFQLIPNVQDAWDYFYEGYNKVLDKHALWKMVKARGEHLPWITRERISLFKQRDKAWPVYRKTGNNADWDVY